MFDFSILHEAIKTLAIIATPCSIWFAYRSYRQVAKKNVSDEKFLKDRLIVDQAITSLRWAYEALTEGDDSAIPKPKRINWLTTARHISRFSKLKASLQTDTYKLICEENEEYWRHRFYTLLNNGKLASRDYYMSKKDRTTFEGIEPISAMVINNFSVWPDSKVDVLDQITPEELIKTGNPFRGSCGRGIRSYMDFLKFRPRTQNLE